MDMVRGRIKGFKAKALNRRKGGRITSAFFINLGVPNEEGRRDEET